MATQNPHRIELGDALRLARENTDLKPAYVEDALRWYAGKASRVERGHRVPVAAEVDKLADLYKLAHDERERLHLLADAARRRESPARVADFAQSYVTMERAAVEVNYYDAELVWGPLQVDGYARAVLANSRTLNVEESVADRAGRRALLVTDDPPHVRVLLGEAVLHRLVGGEEVLVTQLRHLLEVGQLPNVRIRILPFAAGAHRALGVGFTQLRLEVPAITRVYIEGLTDATYIAEPDETDIYVQDYNDLWTRALDEEESATILRRRIGN